MGGSFLASAWSSGGHLFAGGNRSVAMSDQLVEAPAGSGVGVGSRQLLSEQELSPTHSQQQWLSDVF